MARVWDSSLEPTERFVLLCLADAANDDGRCWPSAATIARKTGLSERAVRYSLKALEDAGHLTRQERPGTSTIFVVHPCTTCTPAPRAPLQEVHPTPAPRAPKPKRTINSISSKRERARRCPDDWHPAPLPADLQAEVSQAVPGWEARQLASMRDWSRNSPNGAKVDWDATWRNWLRRELNNERRLARPRVSGPRSEAGDPGELGGMAAAVVALRAQRLAGTG